jgi:hypothetical protein
LPPAYTSVVVGLCHYIPTTHIPKLHLPKHRERGAATLFPYLPECVEGVFSEIRHVFPAKTLMNSAVGQPLGEQIPGSLGPRASFIS